MSINDFLIHAQKDFLTNCYSRESLTPLLSRLEAEYSTEKKPFSVFMLDVDHFKQFNDKRGHLCGDEVLKYFASSIRLDLEAEENVPFRFGGDEFVVVFPHKNASETYRLADRLKKNMRSRPFLYKGQQLKMKFSGGIACYPENGKTINELMENADKALYLSKKRGRAKTIKYGETQYLRLVRAVLLVLVFCAVLFLCYSVKDDIGPFVMSLVDKIKINTTSSPPELVSPPHHLSVPPKPPAPVPSTADLDTIYFKSGREIQGVIIHEDALELKIDLKIRQGGASITVNKSDVSKIVRGAAKPS